MPGELETRILSEADPEAIERWLIGHTGDLTRWGTDLEAIRAQARTLGDDAVAAGLVALRAWLAGGLA